mmetsp:Transcript_22920/g.40688  ORF Transcript_22920/g.40688 Transcript_22920/m.40688 type:complete len:245 (-) Transcript_22920:71-805(-)
MARYQPFSQVFRRHLVFFCIVAVGILHVSNALQGLQNSAQQLVDTCPPQFTKLAPCVDSNSKLQDCMNCVTDYVNAIHQAMADLEGEDEAAMVERDVDLLGMDGNSTNSTDDDLFLLNDTATMPPYSCADLQEDVCAGIESCGQDLCGVAYRETFLTFGGDCQDYFLQLVDCVLDSEGIVVVELEGNDECKLGGRCDGEGDGSDGSDSRPGRNSGGAATTGMSVAVAAMGVTTYILSANFAALL